MRYWTSIRNLVSRESEEPWLTHKSTWLSESRFRFPAAGVLPCNGSLPFSSQTRPGLRHENWPKTRRWPQAHFSLPAWYPKRPRCSLQREFSQPSYSSKTYLKKQTINTRYRGLDYQILEQRGGVFVEHDYGATGLPYLGEEFCSPARSHCERSEQQGMMCTCPDLSAFLHCTSKDSSPYVRSGVESGVRREYPSLLSYYIADVFVGKDARQRI
jgi:hypothetical protein